MIVKAKFNSCRHLADDLLKKIGCSEDTELPIIPGNAYEIHAIFITDQISFLIKDAELHSSIFFETVNNDIPSDWICNYISDENAMIIGPEFIAKNVESYSALVEGEPGSAAKFWTRIEKLPLLNLRDALEKFVRMLRLDKNNPWTKEFEDDLVWCEALLETEATQEDKTLLANNIKRIFTDSNFRNYFPANQNLRNSIPGTGDFERTRNRIYELINRQIEKGKDLSPFGE